MRLVVTVDTEEDQWGTLDCPQYTTANAHRLPELQALCDEWAVRPTYLVSYEMARQDHSATIISELRSRSGAEIGAHCHPWNTPPLGGPTGPEASMLSNLSSDLQLAKLESLTNLLQHRFGDRPLTFRAGRWGLNASLAHNLHRLGYLVDTSVTPFLSWREQFGPDYSRGYPEQFWIAEGNNGGARLLEVPATVGFLQNNADRANRLLKALTGSRLFRAAHAYGILSKLRLLNRIWICPEMTSLRDMIDLTRALRARGATVINLMFHSVTLEPGLTPFVRTRDDAAGFNQRLKEYFQYCRGEGFESVLLRELHDRAGAAVPLGEL